MTAFRVPIEDDGTGGVVAEINLTGQPVTWPSLVSMLEVVGRSTIPVTIVYRPAGPPPLFISFLDAAHALGVELRHLQRLVDEGHLPTVTYNQGRAFRYGGGEWPPLVVDGERRPDPDDPRTGRLIPWDAVVAFARAAVERGSLPHLPRVFSPSTRIGAPKPQRKWRPDTDVIAVLKASDQPRGLTVDEVRARVIAHLATTDKPREPTRVQVYDALKYAVKQGKARNVRAGRQYIPGLHPTAALFVYNGKDRKR